MMGGAELIDSTYQLIGKFLMLRARGTSNVQNTQDFFLWLKAKGITSHANDIVEAVAEKVKPLSKMAFFFNCSLCLHCANY